MLVTGTEVAGRTDPVSGEGECQAASVTPSQAEWSGGGCGRRFWSCPSLPGPSLGPWQLSAVLRGCHLGASPQQNSTLGGYQASQHRLSQGAQSCPLGEIIPGILQIWNCSTLISLFQLACPAQTPRVGPHLAGSLGRREGCHWPAWRPPSNEERRPSLAYIPPCRQGHQGLRTSPCFFPKTAVLPSFLSPPPGSMACA